MEKHYKRKKCTLSSVNLYCHITTLSFHLKKNIIASQYGRQPLLLFLFYCNYPVLQKDNKYWRLARLVGE